MDDQKITTLAGQGTEDPSFLRAAANVAQELAGVSSLDELGPAIDRVVSTFLTVEVSGFFLLEPGGGRLRLLFSRGFSTEEERLAVQTAWDRHPGHVLRTGKVLHIPDTYKDKKRQSSDSPRRIAARSRLFQPIIFDDRVVGTIGLSSSRPNAFDEFALAVLAYAAGLVAAVYGRLEAEQSRKIDQQLLHAIVTDQTELICRFQPDGTRTFANEAYCRYFTWAAKDLVGQRQPPSVADKDVSRIRKTFDSLRPEHPAVTHEHQMILADGRIRWLQWTDRAFFDDAGSLREVQSVGRDITDERMARELLKTERNLALAMASTSDIHTALGHVLGATLQIDRIDGCGVYLRDLDTGALRLAAHIGLSDSFVAKTSSYEPGSAQALLAAAGKTIVQTVSDTTNSRLTTDSLVAEGLRIVVVVPVLFNERVVATLNLGSRSPADLPRYTLDAVETVAAHIGNIMARIQSETELAGSRRNLQTLFDSIDDFLFVLDTRGVVLLVNPAVRNILGWPDEELIGQNFRMLHPVRHRKEALATLGGMLEGRVASYPLPIMTRDGREISVDTKVTKGVWDGQEALFGISRDVSRIRAAEKQLLQSKDELTTTVQKRTSELRRANTRLERENAIRTVAEKELRRNQRLLRRVASDALLSEERERRRIAIEVHDRLGQILLLARIRLDMVASSHPPAESPGRYDELGTLLDGAINDVHNLTFELSPPILYEVGLDAALEWMAEDISRRAGLLHKVSLGPSTRELPFDLKVLLFQVARELLTNVIKHAKATSFQIETWQTRGLAFLAVTDDGKGFIPVETGSPRLRKGGFRLFSIRQRMTHLGGNMSVESAPGDGTRILVEVPIRVRGARRRTIDETDSTGR